MENENSANCGNWSNRNLGAYELGKMEFGKQRGYPIRHTHTYWRQKELYLAVKIIDYGFSDSKCSSFVWHDDTNIFHSVSLCNKYFAGFFYMSVHKHIVDISNVGILPTFS